MRLNESSMDKLIGLIETSVKMQIFSTNGTKQVLLLTLNHLDSIRELACTNQLKQSLDPVQHNLYQGNKLHVCNIYIYIINITPHFANILIDN